MPSGASCGGFLAAQNVGLKFLRDTAEAHTGTAVITVADADNSIVVMPGANALLSERDVAEPALATGDVAVSQFGDSPADRHGLLLQGAIRRRHDHPQSGAGRGVRPRLARPRGHPRSQRDRAWRDLQAPRLARATSDAHIVEAARTLQRQRPPERCGDAGPPRRGGLGAGQGARPFPARPWKAGTRPAPATASSERSLHKPRSAYRLRRHWNTRTWPPRSACSGWAPGPRCPPRPRSREISDCRAARSVPTFLLLRERLRAGSARPRGAPTPASHCLRRRRGASLLEVGSAPVSCLRGQTNLNQWR